VTGVADVGGALLRELDDVELVGLVAPPPHQAEHADQVQRDQSTAAAQDPARARLLKTADDGHHEAPATILRGDAIVPHVAGARTLATLEAKRCRSTSRSTGARTALRCMANSWRRCLKLST
jgi:hypothetical protein